ncbi:MAG: glycosyltransferase, partial [Chloroflexota bacterium]
MNNRPKLAFVLPWYGEELPGGAEAEARRTIKHLAAAGYTVEVFTTCIKDFFADWSRNHHRPGSRSENGIPVHRYPVRPRHKATFDQLNQKLIGRMQLTPQEAADFADNFINAPDLFEAIYENRN